MLMIIYIIIFLICPFFFSNLLHIAVRLKCTTAVRFLRGFLCDEFNVNLKDFFGNTPIHIATASGSRELVELLIEAGADVTIKNNLGEVALHLVQNDKYIAKMLIDAGEKVDSRTKSDQTALHLAAVRNQCELINYLLKRGADINAEDLEGQTALHCAAKANVGRSHFKVIELLVKKGGDINARDDRDMTPLHILEENSNDEAIQFLLKSAIKNIDGQTPFDFLKLRYFCLAIINFVKANYSEAIKFLIRCCRRNAEINFQ